MRHLVFIILLLFILQFGNSNSESLRRQSQESSLEEENEPEEVVGEEEEEEEEIEKEEFEPQEQDNGNDIPLKNPEEETPTLQQSSPQQEEEMSSPSVHEPSGDVPERDIYPLNENQGEESSEVQKPLSQEGAPQEESLEVLPDVQPKDKIVLHVEDAGYKDEKNVIQVVLPVGATVSDLENEAGMKFNIDPRGIQSIYNDQMLTPKEQKLSEWGLDESGLKILIKPGSYVVDLDVDDEPDKTGEYIMRADTELKKVHEVESDVLGLKCSQYLNRTTKQILPQFGPEQCALTPEDVEPLKQLDFRSALLLIFMFAAIFLIAFLLQSCARALAAAANKSNDPYITEAFETVFRQIAIVSLCAALVHILVSMNFVSENIDGLLFGASFDDAISDISFQGHETEVTNIFSLCQNVVDNFILVYLCYVGAMLIFVSRDLMWIREVDAFTVDEIIAVRKSTSVKQLFVFRGEFADSVVSRSVPGLDPPNFWFPEYLRACMVLNAITLLRLPKITLVLFSALSFAFVPVSSWRGNRELSLMIGLTAIPISLIMLVFWRLKTVKSMLLPKNLSSYILQRHQQQTGMLDVYNDEVDVDLISKSLPRYKEIPANSAHGVSRWIKGTSDPNRHESLFYFGRNGPLLLQRVLEGAFLFDMCLLAYGSSLINMQPYLWSEVYGIWPIVIFLTAGIVPVFLIPWLMYDLTVVANTGAMIHHKTLTAVTERERRKFVRRCVLLIDAIRIETTFRQLDEAYANFWSDLQNLCNNFSPTVRAEVDALWESAEKDSKGEVSMAELFRFVNSLGLSVNDESDMDHWKILFDQDGSEGLSKSEFDCMVVVLKEILAEPLDLGAVEQLMIKRFKFDRENPGAVTVDSLGKLISGLRLYWRVPEIRHMMMFMSQIKEAGESMTTCSLREFLDMLGELERETISVLQKVSTLKLAPIELSVDELLIKKPNIKNSTELYTDYYK